VRIISQQPLCYAAAMGETRNPGRGFVRYGDAVWLLTCAVARHGACWGLGLFVWLASTAVLGLCQQSTRKRAVALPSSGVAPRRFCSPES